MKVLKYVRDTNFINLPKTQRNFPFYVILLNTNYFQKEIVQYTFRKADYFICADGGANQLYNAFPTIRQSMIPNAIIGDMDSATQEVQQYYKERGALILKDPDQDTTDLEKCLKYIVKQVNKEVSAKILAIGALGGRIDQTLNQLHLLQKFSTDQNNYSHDFLLMSDSSLVQYLRQGENEIRISDQFEERKGCGLIPLNGNSQKVITQGLRWNLTEQSQALQFGSFISTSNDIVDNVVKVWNSEGLFWSTSLKEIVKL